MRLFACLIVAPQWGYDEPAILSYAISSFCPTSADGLHTLGHGDPQKVGLEAFKAAALPVVALANLDLRWPAKFGHAGIVIPTPNRHQRAVKFLGDDGVGNEAVKVLQLRLLLRWSRVRTAVLFRSPSG